MTHELDSLHRLCERMGVLTAYHDVWGHRHAPPPESLVALLAELGIDASSEQAIVQAEQHAQAEQARQVLPPLHSIAANAGHWTVPVHLHEPAPASLRWSITEESGAQHSGEVDTAALASQRIDTAQDRYREVTLVIALPLPAGYHRLTLAGVDAATQVVAAPSACYRPPALQGNGRTWGPALQLYALRSERNWGIGDFGDLAQVIDQWSARGAGIVGINPLHAMFSHNPAHASPYSPSSRQQLNTLYIDVSAVADWHECEAVQQLVGSAAFQQRLAALRSGEMVDYVGVAAAKNEALRLLFQSFRARHLQARTERASEFARFQAERGRALRRHATFEALQAHFHAADAAVWGWPVWPEAYREPASAEVARFVATHEDEVVYFEYLQWLADLQLAQLRQRCHERGMPLGLYLDLAVSVDRAGSDAWSHAAEYARGATVGAPPDEVNPNGQGWGLPPLRPDSLRRDSQFFIATLRAVMRHAGAVRIDHVMGLLRLYWVPNGCSARDGSYVLYPLRELMAIVALESERNRCVVIGEDLGTVPDEMREAMRQYEMLSYRLLYFEREQGGDFKAPAAYPSNALVAVSTHDLATLAGWWSGHDLAVRQRLGLFPTPEMHAQQMDARRHDRHRLLSALQHAGLLPDGVQPDGANSQPLTPALAEAIHAYAAQTPSQVLMVQLEDTLGLLDQANLPGTVNEHPNWQRKLPVDLAAMAQDARVNSLAARLAAIRPLQRKMHSQAVIPRATYRLQFHIGFTFDDALSVLPYLQRLGVSHVYCSPIMRARPGSLHGYDIVAHDEINPELGGREGFERFTARLKAHGMGQLLDVVPNHMGVFGADNAWWMDVLENGPASLYARHFDIDWHPVNRELEGKVLVPVLGEHYGDVLGSGQLQLHFEAAGGSLVLRYHEHRFPISPRSYRQVLALASTRLNDEAARAALVDLSQGLLQLPTSDAPDATHAHAKDQLKGRLAALVQAQPEVAQAIDDAAQAINTEASHDALHALHEAQSYRLAHWRVAADEINYRRFFDVNELAALRIEEPAVFEATHALALGLAATGQVDGLRIDHPDGLHDPAQYFARLQAGYAERAGLSLPEPTASQRPARPLYVVAEKIAAPHEDVPESWAVHGTTGYRFAMVVNGVLVDTSAAERFDRIWARFSGERDSFAELAYQGKRQVARTSLASELTVLATALTRMARADRRTRDYSFNALRDALAEVAACMPVYRTYLITHASAQDQRYIDWAIAHARRRSEGADRSVFDFIRRVLMGLAPDGTPAAADSPTLQFAARFQQFSAPVAAKGVEDTAFYQYSRLVSLNEVGGDPALFGMTVRAFHGATSDRAACWPHTILATSTHDNKRSEDVRNRLNVLSEMPGAWRVSLARWRRLARALRSEVDGASAPSGADEYLFYQTVLGSLPAAGLGDADLAPYRERIEQYMLKAAREAKRHTSWNCPADDYENALSAFVRGVFARLQPNPLLSDLQTSASALAWFGALNTLAMVLLKFTSPGVPDLYQGNELIDLSLVDPDNRRPVDYALRARELDALAALAEQPGLPAAIGQLVAAPHDGRAKLWATWRLLALRQQQPELFRDGRYVPLGVSGERCEHVLAYARQHGGQTLVVITGRLFARLMNEPGRLPLGAAVWGDAAVEVADALKLADGTRLTSVLTGESVRVDAGRIEVAAAFSHLPFAALWMDR